MAEDKKDSKDEKDDKKDGEKLKEVKKDRRDVVVHPIVLLGVVDHYNRVAKGTTKRVVGTLVGEVSDYSLHITNCFAVPFEEDPRDPQVWFLDHNYHEAMFAMFKKVNTKERIVGWYSTGPKIKPSDLSIHELYRRYCPEPVLVVMDVQPKDLELPMEAYYSVQEQTSDEVFKRTFLHVHSTVGAFEAEEVGVEHLLRDIKNASASTLAVRVGDKIGALKGLAMRLREISQYLSQVVAGKLPMNQEIIYQLQEIFNLMPDQDSEELVRSLATETNDMMLALYLGSMLRSTVALHNLINNKMRNKQQKEKAAEPKDKDKKDEAKKEKEEVKHGITPPKENTVSSSSLKKPSLAGLNFRAVSTAISICQLSATFTIRLLQSALVPIFREIRFVPMAFAEAAPGRSCLPSARCCFHPARHVSTGPEPEHLTSTGHLRKTRISKVRCVRRKDSDNDAAAGLPAEGSNTRARGLGRLQGGRSKPGPRKPAVDIRRSQADEGNAFGQVLSVLLALWLGRFVLELNLFGAEGTYYVSSRSVVATTVTQGGRATTNIQENAQIRTNLWNVASNEM
eukprot:s2804_g4.t1